jgi:hypothetical protein
MLRYSLFLLQIDLFMAYSKLFIEIYATNFQTSESQFMMPRSHPFIVQHVAGAQRTFSVRCDGQTIKCGANMMESFDFLFKLFWVFGLQYPPSLMKFFQLLQFKVYKLVYGKEKIPAGINEVARLLGLK